MKKILQFGVFTLMVSGFMNANAVVMNGVTASNSSDQLTPEQRMAEVQKMLLSVAEQYNKFLEFRTDTPPTKAACSVLYDFIMALKNCSDGEIDRQIMPMLCSREKPYPEPLVALVDAVKHLKAAKSCTFETEEDWAPYFDIISILKANGKTLAETFPRPMNGEFLIDFEKISGEINEACIEKRIQGIKSLHNIGLVNRVLFFVDDRIIGALSENLNLENDTELKEIEFRVRRGSFAAVHLLLRRLPKTIRRLRVNAYSFSFEERFRLFITSLETFPELKILLLTGPKREAFGSEEFNLKLILCAALHPSLKLIFFCLNLLRSGNSEDCTKSDLNRAIKVAKMDWNSDVIANVLMAIRTCRPCLKKPYDHVDFLMHELTSMNDLRNRLRSTGKIENSIIDNDFIAASRKFREIVEDEYDKGNIKTDENFRRLFSKAYAAFEYELMELSDKRLQKILDAAHG